MFGRLGRRVPRLQWSPNRFRFADTSYNSLGKVLLPLATPLGKPTIFLQLDVVSADIPALLGKDVLHRESLMADKVGNRLKKRSVVHDNGSYFYFDEWHMPLYRSKSGHVYVEMDSSTTVMFTRPQLGKLHRQFFHPSS